MGAKCKGGLQYYNITILLIFILYKAEKCATLVHAFFPLDIIKIIKLLTTQNISCLYKFITFTGSSNRPLLTSVASICFEPSPSEM